MDKRPRHRPEKNEQSSDITNVDVRKTLLARGALYNTSERSSLDTDTTTTNTPPPNADPSPLLHRLSSSPETATSTADLPAKMGSYAPQVGGHTAETALASEPRCDPDAHATTETSHWHITGDHYSPAPFSPSTTNWTIRSSLTIPQHNHFCSDDKASSSYHFRQPGEQGQISTSPTNMMAVNARYDSMDDEEDWPFEDEEDDPSPPYHPPTPPLYKRSP